MSKSHQFTPQVRNWANLIGNATSDSLECFEVKDNETGDTMLGLILGDIDSDPESPLLLLHNDGQFEFRHGGGHSMFVRDTASQFVVIGQIIAACHSGVAFEVPDCPQCKMEEMK